MASSKIKILCIILFLFMIFGYMNFYHSYQDDEPTQKETHLVTLNSSAECPEVPPKLVGRLKVVVDISSEEEIGTTDLEPGGEYVPRCKPRTSLAVLIPFRDREEHLWSFLNHLHPILKRQQAHYRIFLVNQADNLTFNRAALFNVGFIEATKLFDWDCFIFHDVDLLTENDRNLYRCSSNPVHLSSATNTHGYKLMKKELFGGVSAMTREQIEKVNGFSNQFWGWGGEDDDMSWRIRNAGYNLTHSDLKLGRYTMFKHDHDAGNPINEDRYPFLKEKTPKYASIDGLNNIIYTVIEQENRILYTNISVQLVYPIPVDFSSKS